MLAQTLLLALPILAAAAPTWDHKEAPKEEKKHDDHKDGKDLIDSGVFHFTSTYKAYLTPDTIINNSQVAVPGLEGGSGEVHLGINAEEEYICYNIAVYIKGNYSSPAVTATHIHQAAFGAAGPPRIAFPNPTGDSPIDEFGRRTSYGCIKGGNGFRTGINAANSTVDTGSAFRLSQIEANPPGFFFDTHTVEFAAGAIRGQLELEESAY